MQKYNRVSFSVVLFALVALLLPGTAMANDIEDDLRLLMASVNFELAAVGAEYRVEVVEYLTSVDEIGRTVFFSNVGNKQLGFDFVPGDSRRAWSGAGAGDDITWTSDMVEGDAGVGQALTQAALSDAMATWDDLNCSELPLTELQIAGDLGLVQLIISGTGSDPVADIVHGGFGSPVDALLPSPIIAATFTFGFTDGGEFTDINNDGKLDAALREIYYTFNFPWGVGNNIDIETVVLHEVGHGLSQGHFGTLHQTDSNGKFHFSPAAVMNAGYTGVRRDITATDNAGHCGIWADWPQN